jgi:hypothetical protein
LKNPIHGKAFRTDPNFFRCFFGWLQGRDGEFYKILFPLRFYTTVVRAGGGAWNARGRETLFGLAGDGSLEPPEGSVSAMRSDSAIGRGPMLLKTPNYRQQAGRRRLAVAGGVVALALASAIAGALTQPVSSPRTATGPFSYFPSE